MLKKGIYARKQKNILKKLGNTVKTRLFGYNYSITIGISAK